MTSSTGIGLNTRRSDRNGLLLWLHEVLFSLNLGLVVALSLYANFHGAAVGTIKRIIRPLFEVPKGVIDWDQGGYIALSLLALALAILFLLALRLISETLACELILRSIAGVVVIATLPAGYLCLYLAHLMPFGLAGPSPPWVWLLAELAIAILCTILYSHGKWMIPLWGTFLLLILHFGLWGRLFLGGPLFFFWRGHLFKPAFPLVGLSSMLVWGRYVAQQHARHPTTITPD